MSNINFRCRKKQNLLLINSNKQWELGQMLDKNFQDPSSENYSKKINIPKYIFENQLKILRWGGPMGAHLCWNYIIYLHIQKYLI